MTNRLMELLFGCWHAHTSKPITLRANVAGPLATYVVCLDCGKEFEYDWNRMRISGPIRRAA